MTAVTIAQVRAAAAELETAMRSTDDFESFEMVQHEGLFGLSIDGGPARYLGSTKAETLEKIGGLLADIRDPGRLLPLINSRGVIELDPDDPSATVCGTCGRGWDDSVSTSVTPTPAGRCPFETEHDLEDDWDETGPEAMSGDELLALYYSTRDENESLRESVAEAEKAAENASQAVSEVVTILVLETWNEQACNQIGNVLLKAGYATVSRGYFSAVES